MDENSFSYTYSAKDNNEVKKIREKYLPQNKGKTNYEKIKELDASTTKKGTAIAIALGTISALIFGTGMCMVMLWQMMLIGIIVGIIGLVGVAITYPLYVKIQKEEQEKVREEILKLCDEELKR